MRLFVGQCNFLFRLEDLFNPRRRCVYVTSGVHGTGRSVRLRAVATPRWCESVIRWVTESHLCSICSTVYCCVSLYGWWRSSRAPGTLSSSSAGCSSTTSTTAIRSSSNTSPVRIRDCNPGILIPVIGDFTIPGFRNYKN